MQTSVYRMDEKQGPKHHWCLSWNSNTLATSCEELTHWKRPWCWEGLGAGGEGDDRGWGGWMASPTQWTWVWVNSGSWCWTGRPGTLWFRGSRRVRHDWATELNWTELIKLFQHHLLNRLYFLGCISFPPLSRIHSVYSDLFLGSLILFHWSLCDFFCRYHTVLMTVML